jgi:hypothetical protein
VVFESADGPSANSALDFAGSQRALVPSCIGIGPAQVVGPGQPWELLFASLRCVARGAATFASRYSERRGRSAPRMITGARQDESRRLGATMQSRRSSAPAWAQNDAPERRSLPSWP